MVAWALVRGCVILIRDKRSFCDPDGVLDLYITDYGYYGDGDTRVHCISTTRTNAICSDQANAFQTWYFVYCTVYGIVHYFDISAVIQ